MTGHDITSIIEVQRTNSSSRCPDLFFSPIVAVTRSSPFFSNQKKCSGQILLHRPLVCSIRLWPFRCVYLIVEPVSSIPCIDAQMRLWTNDTWFVVRIVFTSHVPIAFYVVASRSIIVTFLFTLWSRADLDIGYCTPDDFGIP
jgi:hypothetical protein